MIKITKGKMTKSNLETQLDNVNHTMELVRTVTALLILALQIVILIKLFS
tara:strand:- start:211 stop:360 length:150 start_codon:yes stop_codon:yes gene_type:complete